MKIMLSNNASSWIAAASKICTTLCMIVIVYSELYPYNGQRYIMIGDWFYIVGPFPHFNNNTYTLYIEHTLNLEGFVVK